MEIFSSKWLSKHYFLSLSNLFYSKTVSCVVIFESGYLIKCDYDLKNEKVALIDEIISLSRLFKFDTKEWKKEWIVNLHFINEERDPFLPPVTQEFIISITMFDGFKEMLKYQLSSIKNTKVINEII